MKPVTPLLLLLALGCATPRVNAPAAPARCVPDKAAVTLAHGDPRVGTYVSRPWGFATSSYWIEGPGGLVLIDTQFLPSAAEEFVDWAEQVTGKKAVLAIVLHANPDKFNGTATLQKRGIRVITSEQVKALLPEVHEKRVKAFYERYQPDYPRELPAPESFGSQTMDLQAAGLELTLHVMGPGVSEAHVAVEFDEHLFVGDLVANDAHGWLEIGKTDQWLARLAELKDLEPTYVHPGRGPSGGPGLLDDQEAYLRRVIDIVAAEKPTLPIDEAALTRARERVEAAYPGYGYRVFLKLGLPAEWERQARGGK
ncbi:MAG: MBL fold metallo-hydrolase [Myxococcales bacterium]